MSLRHSAPTSIYIRVLTDRHSQQYAQVACKSQFNIRYSVLTKLVAPSGEMMGTRPSNKTRY